MLLDSLHQQLKRLEQDRGIYDGQIAAQRQETLSAQQILKEAAGEMEMISKYYCMNKEQPGRVGTALHIRKQANLSSRVRLEM